MRSSLFCSPTETRESIFHTRISKPGQLDTSMSVVDNETKRHSDVVDYMFLFTIKFDLNENAHRFFVPFLGKIEVVAMDDEEDIDKDKEMVRVPEGIEACESLDDFGEVQAVAAEPWLSQGECYDHQHHHHHPGPPFRPLHEPPIVIRSYFTEKRLHRFILSVGRME